MKKKKKSLDRYQHLRRGQVVFAPPEMLEGCYRDGEFQPVYNPDVYVDPYCRFYRGTYVERQLVISPAVLRQLIDMGAFYGFYRCGEFRIERQSLLRYLDQFHFTFRTSESQPPAVYIHTSSKRKELPNLTAHPKRHDFLPELWGTDKVAEYIQTRGNPQMQKNTIHRALIRLSEYGLISFYRVSGVFRYSREDWLESLRTIIRMPDLTHGNLGRPMQSPFIILAPFIVAIMQEEGLDPKPLKTYFKYLESRRIYSQKRRQRSATLDTISAIVTEAQDRFQHSILRYFDTDDSEIQERLYKIRKELFPRDAA